MSDSIRPAEVPDEEVPGEEVPGEEVPGEEVPVANHAQSLPSSPTIQCTFRDLKFGTFDGGPEFVVRSANIVKESKYFRRLLVENAHRFTHQPVTNLDIGLTHAMPEVLRMLFHWADNEQILETHTLAEYKSIPAGHESSPWIKLIALYHEAERFEMDGLRCAIFSKIIEMSFAVETVPCGALRAVYARTRKGDGLRRLFIDLTLHRVDSAEYPTYFPKWTREILQDMLIAVKMSPIRHASYCCKPSDYLTNPHWTHEDIMRQWRERESLDS